jgi:hypothetical protein
VEHVAHAGWLLDPEVSPEQRVARRWMAVLADAYRERWFLSAVHASKAAIKSAKSTRERVRDEVSRRFPGSDLAWSIEDAPTGPPWVVAGQTFPGLGQRVRRFGEYAGLDDLPGLYDLLSLHAHPNLHAALARSVQVVQHDSFTQFRFVGDVELTVRLLHVASVYLYRAGMVLCSYFHLDPTSLDAWADALEACRG